MENIRKNFEKELKNLEIGDEDPINLKVAATMFKRKALKVHSDKTHLDDDEEFKELLHDYNVLKDAINACMEEGEFVEKTDLQNFFERHNFAKEFSKSWTIFIEIPA